jgi:hypothetical protein
VTVTNDELEPTNRVCINYIGDREYLEESGRKTKDVIVDEPCIELSGIQGLRIKRETDVLPDDREIFVREGNIDEPWTDIYMSASYILSVKTNGSFLLASGPEIPRVEVVNYSLRVSGVTVFTFVPHKRYFMSVIFSYGSRRYVNDTNFVTIVVGDKIISHYVRPQYNRTRVLFGAESDSVMIEKMIISKFHDGSIGVPGALSFPLTFGAYQTNRMEVFEVVYSHAWKIINYSRKMLDKFTKGCSK